LALISIITAFRIVQCRYIEYKSLESVGIYPELDLGRNSRCNLGRLQRGQQARKAWLGAYLAYITPVRFGVRNVDKGTTKCEGSISNQLTVFSS